MHPILKNTFAIIAGLVTGSLVNMGIIMLSGSVIPPPDGVDTSTMDGLKEGMALFEAKHFILPFLAHALGTLAGAFVAARLAATRALTMAMCIGCFFLLGGIANVAWLPAPLWFEVVDLVFAYLPMAWLGAKLTRKSTVSH